MGMLLRLDMKAKGAGGRVILSNVRAEILELLSMSRIDRVLEIRENQSAALREF